MNEKPIVNKKLKLQSPFEYYLIKKVGKNNIFIIATPYKLLHTPELRVDTYDDELDTELEGYVKVISGYHEMIVRKK